MKATHWLLKGSFFWSLFFSVLFVTSGCKQYGDDSSYDYSGHYLFSGRILDQETLTPVKGAEVTVYADQSTVETERTTEEKVCITDAQGRFSAAVARNPFGDYDHPSYCFSVQHPKYKDGYKGFYYCSGVKIYLTRIK